MTMIASLNRCAIFDAMWQPKPRRNSEMMMRAALPSATVGGVLRSAATPRKTMPSFQRSSLAMASWLK
jgi:hypothetical protein